MDESDAHLVVVDVMITKTHSLWTAAAGRFGRRSLLRAPIDGPVAGLGEQYPSAGNRLPEAGTWQQG